MNNELELFEVVPETRKYWFLRTQGGAYYDEFTSESFIAIGWNKITDPERLLSMKREDAYHVIQEFYPDEKRPGKIYNSIHRFFRQMRENDIVMIPSSSSNKIRFGIIESPATNKKINPEKGSCPYFKRRRVNWIKTLDRERMDPYLYRMTRPQNTISEASEYAAYIDRTIGSLFVKGKRAHMVIPIKTKHDISAVDLYDFMDMIFQTITLLNNSEVLTKKYSKKDLDIKLNVQSPGLMEYITVPELMFGIGTIMVFVVGGSFAVNWTKESKELNANSEGLVGKVLNFLTKRKDQEFELEKLRKQHQLLKEKLNYELPKEITSLSEVAVADEKAVNSDMEKRSE